MFSQYYRLTIFPVTDSSSQTLWKKSRRFARRSTCGTPANANKGVIVQLEAPGKATTAVMSRLQPVVFVLLVLCCQVVFSKNAKEVETIGPCVNGLCPTSYSCSHNDKCMREMPRARVGSMAIGPCVNEQCPVGHTCKRSDYQCYPTA
ncbi:unnamed protein product [Caenorhabditis auriculariae]|uniref:CC domain-containing protein n=1 Tax=Caenorhabditis auriculariae TaxID=2777116 RepID=A0A8S1HRS2_9PELO|nr:unnamed protein product [Caenorhabditis auriculariae]